jgi:hypothetical protein
MWTLPLLTVVNGPLVGCQVPEADPWIIRCAQAHGWRYVVDTDEGERVWRLVSPIVDTPSGERLAA